MVRRYAMRNSGLGVKEARGRPGHVLSHGGRCGVTCRYLKENGGRVEADSQKTIAVDFELTISPIPLAALAASTRRLA